MTTAEDKAAAKAAADAKKAEDKAAKDAGAAAAKAAADAKKAEDKAAKDAGAAAAKAAADAAKADSPIVVKYRDHIGQPTEREFSLEVHGEDFAKLAEEFKATNASKIIE